MEYCGEIRRRRTTFALTERFWILLGFLLLACGIWVAAQTGMRGQGLGYLLIFAAPFAILAESKKR